MAESLGTCLQMLATRQSTSSSRIMLPSTSKLDTKATIQAKMSSSFSISFTKPFHQSSSSPLRDNNVVTRAMSDNNDTKYVSGLPIDLRGKRAFIAGVADDKGYGWAIAKALASAGSEILVGTWVPKYFGLNHVSEIPNLIGTVEVPDVPFSSISILKKYGEEDMVYKIFSRKIMQDSLLDEIFSMRKETIRIDWPAYPHFEAPEFFSPIILDGKHLYYINSFENAASTIECSAVAAENVARLIVSRLSDEHQNVPNKKSNTADRDLLHLDL